MRKFSLRSLAKALHPRYQTLHLEYPVEMRPRYGHGRPPHPQLLEIIERDRPVYREQLEKALRFRDNFFSIADASVERDPARPGWNNGFLPGLDMVMLYTFLADGQVHRYVEIGSGNSTKVAHLARTDHRLDFSITSIDPAPRAEIDQLADTVLRRPFEQDDHSWLAQIAAGDIVFVDNSHRVFPNSDATVFFLEILPRLPVGTIVHVHDVFLPYDYPQEMCDRYYSEQYLLAAMLLANPEKYRTLMPAYFASGDADLRNILEPLWADPRMPKVEQHGGAYWFRIAG